MNNDFINIPEKDLRGPETESDQYAEEVRRAVEDASHDSPEASDRRSDERSQMY